MNESKPKTQTKAITIRIPVALHAQLAEAAAANVWTVNDEINNRLRAGRVLEQLRELSAQVEELKAIVGKKTS